MSTLAEIRVDVQANWPTNYHSSDLDNDKTDEFINTVQRKICRNYNFTWMKQQVTRDTSDETREYALPTAGDSNWTDAEAGTVRKYKDEVSCELTNAQNYRVPLTKRYKQDIENDPLFKKTTGKGTPSHYCIERKILSLYELPDHAANSNTAWTINLEFYGYLAELSGDDDTNTITEDHPKVLEYGATAMGYRFGLDYEQAEYWEAKMNEVMAEMISDDRGREFGNIETGFEPMVGQSLGDNR